jgi:plastocyanin
MHTSRTLKWTAVSGLFAALGIFSASGAWALGVNHPVDITKFQPWFTPVTLSVGVGDTVTWTNNDPDTTHTVTSLTTAPLGAQIPLPSGIPVGVAFESGKMKPGDVFTLTFLTPGINPYVCIIHPWMAAAVSVGLTGAAASGPVADILQGSDSQDMPTPLAQGFVGIGEWCTTATYEFSGQAPFPGVVHCGSAHLWQDQTVANGTAPLESAAASGVTAANGFPPIACGPGVRQVGGRFDGTTTAHNLWNNNHFTPVGTLIGPNGTALGNAPGSVISMPARNCYTWATNLHGQTFQWIKRNGAQQVMPQSTQSGFASDVTHVMTNPGGTVAWVTMESGTGTGPTTGGSGVGVFNPNNTGTIPAVVTQIVTTGSNEPHGNWVCGDGRHDTIPAPLANTIGVITIPSTPTAADGGVVAFYPSLGIYPVASGATIGCTKSYTGNAVDNNVSVTNAMNAVPCTPLTCTGGILPVVDLGVCSSCTLIGLPTPTISVPIQITPTPDGINKMIVNVSKASKLAIIDTTSDIVIATIDCANGCHGGHIGPKLGGGVYYVGSAAYQDKMSIVDVAHNTKVGDVPTNMHSLLGLQGTTPLGQSFVTTISPAVGWNSGTIAWPQMPPWK